MFRVKPSLLAGGVLLVLVLAIGFPSEVAAEKSLGQLISCAHDIKGEVFVKNEKQIVIKGFNYDGKGPRAWFHAKLKSSTDDEIYLSGDGFLTIPYPVDDAACPPLKMEPFKDQDISLNLPVSIKDLKTIGILCYEKCHSFGHIVITDDMVKDVEAAPAEVTTTDICTTHDDVKKHKAGCTKSALTGVKEKHNKVKPEGCGGAGATGTGTGEGSKGNSTESAASQLFPSLIGLIAGGILAATLNL